MTTDMTDDCDDMPEADFPEVRPIAAVLEEIGSLRDRCRDAATASDAATIFERSLSVLLELRVPRMPDTDEELEVMIDEALADPRPSLDGDEVMAGLKAHGETFARFLEHYRFSVTRSAWKSAGTALMPREDGLRWEDGAHRLSIVVDEDDGGSATIRHDDGTSTCCASQVAGLAVLGAVLTAHLERPAVWRR